MLLMTDCLGGTHDAMVNMRTFMAVLDEEVGAARGSFFRCRQQSMDLEWCKVVLWIWK